MEDPITQTVQALEEPLSHVHIALMPVPESLNALALLQARLQRSLPPEHASRIAWIPPEFFGIVLAYIGRIRPSLLEILHDIMKETFLPETAFTLQAHRFSTAHDAQGTPRVVGVGLALSEPLLALRARLAERLARHGIECLPQEFTPRITLARLPEDAGPVMSVLEGLSSAFPVTLQFSHADLSNREGLRRAVLARVIPGKPPVQGALQKLHGCCREQSNRFALHGGLDCPMRNIPEYALECFETGGTPAHPPETPADANVDAEIVHEGIQDLLRSGRTRLSASAAESRVQESPAFAESEKPKADDQQHSEKKAEGPRKGLSVNYRDPRQKERGRPDFQKKTNDRETQKRPREQENPRQHSENESRQSRPKDRDRRKKPQDSAPKPPGTPGGGE